ncbi:dihydrodipicolinate synthase family protein [Urbifossiella limnaea]|uniref:N-acetylneuraminate lyase n=1 Tax=Urbifossiella limnaea TaxID=2528023 RepID=A0A517XR78_9BACT|nr:dihydrodipicolinate synthase family protein [Urbifossiella limnaea]QDU20018.1 N-acetylneuraminate lyase [Urbifossiella limnaea]
MPPPFAGIWPAMLTPTTSDGRANLPACETLVDLFARQQLGGIYLVGSTGGWPLFSVAERKEIAATVVKAAAGRIPVMVHVGAVSTADAVELAEHAAGLGADAVSAVGPIYYKHPAEVAFGFYRRLGAATPLPLFAYHLSGVNQSSLGPRDVAARLLDIPTVAGMKITDHDLFPFGLIRGVAGDRLRLFSGADEVMCHAVLSGACGAIGTFYNLWGPSCAAARAATEGGDVAAGRAFMLRFQSAIADALAGGVWSFLRAGMRLKYGLDVGMPRPPLGSSDGVWSDEQVRELLARVDGPA